MNQPAQNENLAALPADELFEIAKKAAAAKQPDKMIEALYASHFLDGLVRLLAKKWERLPRPEIEECVAQAVNQAYMHLAEKPGIINLGGWLYKVAFRRADDLWNKHYRNREGEDSLDSIASKDQLSEAEHLRQDELADSKRAEAIRHARRLLPKIGHGQIADVMGLIIDAVEQEIPDLPPKEIADVLGISPDAARTLRSRGFDRLARIARKEGIEIPEFRTESEHGAELTDKEEGGLL